MSAERSIGIGLLGLGTVGGGIAKILQDKADVYARQIGSRLELRRVLVRDVGKEREVQVPGGALTANPDDVLDDPAIALVIEVMGGEEPAHRYLRRALEAGKFVVTANKEVMAKHGGELLRLARANNVDLLYEASVGGGIPIIAPLKRDLLANDINSVTAIINGTTNYILTSMSKEGVSFAEALAQAQALGYAEPDPTNDIEGIDASYKIAILATLSFHTDVLPDVVYREGITKLTARDFVYARELGYAIKLLAIARRRGTSGIEVRVHPALVPFGQLLANVDGVMNAVEIEGDLLPRVLFQGPGAGSLPTTSSVVGDVLDAAVSISNSVYWPHSFRRDAGVKPLPIEQTESRYYLRIGVADEPGVLARIAGCLADARISIASVLQKEGDDGRGVEIVIMTHDAIEVAMREALGRIGELAGITGVEQMIRVRP